MSPSDFKLPIPIAVILTLLFVTKEVLTKRPLELSTGIGIPALIHVGLRYQVGQTKIGTNIGSLPGFRQRPLSATADVYYHSGRNAKLMDGSTWFVNFGLIIFATMGSMCLRNMYMKWQLGREIHNSQTANLDIGAGFTYELSHTSKIKESSCGWLSGILSMPDLIPSISLKFNFKL